MLACRLLKEVCAKPASLVAQAAWATAGLGRPAAASVAVGGCRRGLADGHKSAADEFVSTAAGGGWLRLAVGM